MKSTFPPEFYAEMYDLLAEMAGAPASMKDSFVHYATQEVDDRFEWRFQGVFGFGGKIWRRLDKYDSNTQTSYYKHDISGYPEDYTPKLRKLQAEINERLAQMTADFYEGIWKSNR